MKKSITISILAVLILTILLFTACKSNDGAAGDGDDVSNAQNPNGAATDIVFWGFGNDAYFQNYYTAFAADMPEYNLQHDVGLAPFSDFLSAYLSNNPPDIYIAENQDKKQMIYTDMIRPLEDYYTKDTAFDISKLNPAVIRQGSGDDGKFYFWCDLDGSVLYYNKGHFSAAGLDESKPPKTWSELISYAKACTVTDSMGSLKQLGFWDGADTENYFAGAMGVSWFDDTGEKLTINDETTQKVFEFCSTIPNKVYGGRDKIPASVTFGSEFDNLSMHISDINVRIHQLSLTGKPWGMGYIPVNDGYTGAQQMPAYSKLGYCLPQRSKNPMGGWMFTRWYFTNGLVVGEKIKYDQNPSKFSPYINTYAPTKEMVDKTFTKDLTNEDVKTMLSLRDEMIESKAFKLNEPISSVTFDEVYKVYVGKIYSGEMTVKDALSSLQKEAQTKIDDWLKEQAK